MAERRRAHNLPPRGRPWWNTVLVGVALASLLAGGLAWLAEGQGRRVALVVLMVVAVAMPLVLNHRSLARPEQAIVGGAGYVVPRSRRVQLLHTGLTVAYNVGIVVVVVAALKRFELVTLRFDPGAVAGFPAFISVFVGLMALAVKWRIEEQGGVIRSWYTRAHGWLLFVVAAIALLAGGWLALFGEVRADGVPVLTEPDLVVVALVVTLGVATQVFLAANLPNIVDAGANLVRLFRRQEGLPAEGTPPYVYAALVAAGGAVIVGFLLTRFDVVAGLGGFRNERVALLLLLFPVALALFFLSSALQILRESRRGLYKKKIPTQLRNALLVYSLSAIGALTFGSLLLLNLTGRIEDLGPLVADRELSKDLILLTILTGVGPVGWYLHRQNKRVDHIESRLPDFLNDLAETRRAGLTLAAALQSTAVSDYGALTQEIRKMAHQVSWGVPFTEALAQFADRVPTNLVKRSCFLIIEASKTGGSVTEILKAAARDAYEIKGLEAERRVTMMTYLIVIYVIFAVFMTVIAVLDTQFIPEVLAANEAVEASGGTAFGGAELDRGTLQFVYFNAAVIQAVGNGIVGGVLAEARITAGFRHVAIMVAMAWVLFRVLLGL